MMFTLALIAWSLYDGLQVSVINAFRMLVCTVFGGFLVIDIQRIIKKRATNAK